MKIKNRIKSRQDFQKVIHEGKVLKNREYVVYFKENGLGYARVGVSSPKKIGNAVTRNKVRRQIKAILNLVLDLNKSIDVIVVARSSYNPKDSHLNNKTSLEKLINSIGE